MSETKSKPYNVSISVANSKVVYRFNDKQQIVGVDERTVTGVVKPIVPNSLILMLHLIVMMRCMLLMSISIKVITSHIRMR